MKYRLLLIATSATLLAGCPILDDDDDTPPADTLVSYTVEVKNLTPNQPLSPLAVLAHNADYQLFEIGQPASAALELLAESGDNSEVLNDGSVAYSFSGAGVILPSSSDTVTITVDPQEAQYLSISSMLVNTNDGFVGETQISLANLGIGDNMSINMAVWDSGTEANDEAAATIPGPAAGGEGFNSNRDDNDRVSFHAGVISQDDGLESSVLTASHRFLNPGARLTITRTE
ncbi:spondin domain-containing protein [Photobacterium minamisatsumaniensis]|uniref:spondin domain-containing protein n=1 Tax=Photobacterium minamisatsumaniensis TaxID=2910233 RepID=UPI003D0F1336